MTDSCTQSDMGSLVPGASSQKFLCAGGKTDGYDWTIMVAKEGDGMRVVVTCAPESLYANVDLARYGSVCRYVACCDEYTE